MPDPTDLEELFEDLTEEGLLDEIEEDGELGLEGYEDVIADAVDDVQPGEMTFAPDGGSVPGTYYTRAHNLTDAILRILGDVEFETTTAGGLRRTLPLAHPQRPSYVAVKARARGMGEARLAWVEASDFEGNSVAAYGEYPLYKIDVSFQQPPYAILSDDAIDLEALHWFEDDGTEFGAGLGGEIVPAEWTRYVYAQKGKSVTQIVTAQGGQLVLHDDGETRAFNAMPSMRLPTGTFTLTWFRVPYRFFLDAKNRFDRALGRINQSEFFGYEEGQLYLDSVEATPYCPPIPGWDLGVLGFTRSTEQHADIRMTFHTRVQTAAHEVTPSNPSFIANGFNLYPTAADPSRWLYATTSSTPPDPDNPPVFLSYEMRRLFKDPLVDPED